MLRYAYIFLALIPSLVRATEDGDAARFFQDYLTKCGTNEIRCLWFLQGSSRTGMMMTLNLQNYTGFTAREVYNWATQASETHTLTHSQVLRLKEITGQMPPSEQNLEFRRTVSISIRSGAKVQVFHYDRQHAPAVIQRIYDIGGGYFYGGKDP
jgi:hypothetical protein